MTPREPEEDVRSRQKGRAKFMAAALLAFVVLLYFITIAKMTVAE